MKVLVTGGTSGVGYECTKALRRNGHKVTITGRDVQRGQQVSKETKSTFLRLDLASQESIRSFVKSLQENSESGFDAIICNAGIQFATNKTKNEDGFEMTFAVNHLGHFLLIHQLIESNLINRPSRIVVVSSGTHEPEQKTGVEPPRYISAEQVSKGDFSKPTPLGDMKSGHCAYSTSKLCNILFTKELNRIIRQQNIDDITVNAFDPGLTPGTNLTRNGAFIISVLFKTCPVWLLRSMFSNVHHIHESGTSLANLATKEEYNNQSGNYYEHLNLKPFIAESSVASKSEEFAKDLWDFSLSAVHIEDTENAFKFQ